MALDPCIKEFGKNWKSEYSRILSAIKRYDRIAVFRHIIPDFDALGTQMGLATWLKDNFPEKEIKVFGDNHVTFTPRLYPVMDSVNQDWFKEPFLAIIVDVGNVSRIADPRFKKGKFKIKIDHHPDVEHWGKVSIVDTEAAAAAEIVVDMLLNFKGNYVISKTAAFYFLSALIGDSGSFKYSSTSQHTFAVAGELLKTGVDISEVHKQMFVKQIDDLKVTAYILNHYEISDKGVAYYVLSDAVQKELKITAERGKENVNLFANVDGINAWCSISEDISDNCWRVSIRSKEVPINGVAAMFDGGGHAQASGAQLKSLDELPRFIEELGKLF